MESGARAAAVEDSAWWPDVGMPMDIRKQFGGRNRPGQAVGIGTRSPRPDSSRVDSRHRFRRAVLGSLIAVAGLIFVAALAVWLVSTEVAVNWQSAFATLSVDIDCGVLFLSWGLHMPPGWWDGYEVYPQKRWWFSTPSTWSIVQLYPDGGLTGSRRWVALPLWLIALTSLYAVFGLVALYRRVGHPQRLWGVSDASERRQIVALARAQWRKRHPWRTLRLFLILALPVSIALGLISGRFKLRTMALGVWYEVLLVVSIALSMALIALIVRRQYGGPEGIRETLRTLGRCTECGYPANSASSQQCPECGEITLRDEGDAAS